MVRSNSKRSRKNIRRDEFLGLALRNLAQTGQATLHLNALIDSLPVTSGSFYHHFKNKRDFLAELIAYWDESDTQGIIGELENLKAEATEQDRLWVLITAIDQRQLTRWDRVIRAIAVGDPELEALVEKVDRKRLAYVQQLFAGMGFSGAELRMRTRVFVTTMSQESTLRVAVPGKQRRQYLEDLHAFFTRS